MKLYLEKHVYRFFVNDLKEEISTDHILSCDLCRFYLASIEAAVEHVKAGNMDNIALGVANPQRLQVFTKNTSNDGIWEHVEANDPSNIPSLDALFEVSLRLRKYIKTDYCK